MSNINYNSKKTICCICALVVFCTLGAHAGEPGQKKTDIPKSKDLVREIRSLSESEIYRRASKNARDKLALEQYEKRGAETTSLTKNIVLSNPDNAALLYYQTFLLRPEPNMATFRKIMDVLGGTAEPDRQIRTYLGRCLTTSQLTEAASQIPQCTWGIWHPDGYEPVLGNLVSEVRQLEYILTLDARTLAADGHYRAALSRCLTTRRLARHVGDYTTLLYLLSMHIDSGAQFTIQHILCVMPPETNTLMWLRGQLATVQGPRLSFARAIQTDFEFILHDMQTKTNILKEIKHQLAENTENEQVEEKSKKLTDEELLRSAREPYAHFLDSILRIIDSDMTYEQKSLEIKVLTSKMIDEYGSDPAAGYVIDMSGAYAGQILTWYNLQVRHTALNNALNAAIEIYLIYAKTGQIPEKLPDNLSKDPYSSKDFEYKITEDGFILRYRIKPVNEREVRQYEFKVKSKD